MQRVFDRTANVARHHLWRSQPDGLTWWLGKVGALAAAITIAVAPAMPVHAQDGPGIKPGNIAVTGFSGTKLPGGGLKPGVDPIDATFIDPEGAALKIFDISDLGGAPQGKPVKVPSVLALKAKDIGQVFGVAFDAPPDGGKPSLYLAATSIYGLQIAAERDGALMRLVKGAADAKWMPGQFGTEKGGGPGSIWKVDGATGKVELFADVPSGANPNGGAALGALAHDPLTASLYVPSLETGLIHQISPDGQIIAQFDHGTSGREKAGLEAIAYDAAQGASIQHPDFDVETPSTWGYADTRRLVFAVAINSGRLYYSVAEGAQVWSVALDEQGGFTDDIRKELDVAGVATGNMITGIVFDGKGDMLLAQRGKIAASYDYGTLALPNSPSALHFTWDETAKSWTAKTKEFPVSLSPPHRASNGGIALGYGYDAKGRIKTGVCRGTVWITGDNLNDPATTEAINGLQAMSKDMGTARALPAVDGADLQIEGIAPEELPKLEPVTKSWLIDFDNVSLGSDAYGHIGALSIFAPECAGAGEAPLSERPDVVAGGVEPGYIWPELDGFDPPPGGFPIPDPILPGTPGIDITKACLPSPFGGTVKCTITVTNTGDEMIDEAITVSDDTVIAAGAGAGGALSIASVTPDGGEWACTPTPPATSMVCGLPPGTLAPGASRSFEVEIDTSTMIADGNVGFENCATLGAPHAGTACDNGGADIAIKKTAEPGCVAGATCTFKYEITNNASQPFNGTVRLTDHDQRTGAGAGATFPLNATFSPSLGCNGGDPAQIPFTCEANLSLAANETRVIDVQVDMPAPPAVPANFWVRNCVMATAPGLPLDPVTGTPFDSTTLMDLMQTGTSSGGTFGSGGAVGCAWMAVGAPIPLTNLKLTKTSLGKCGKSAADPNFVDCDFEITLTNTGPMPFPAQAVTIDEQLDITSGTILTSDPNWSAAVLGPPGAFQLTNPNFALPADPGSNTYTIPVTVRTARADIEAAMNSCTVGNTAVISSPVTGGAIAWDNFSNTDDFDDAIADAALLEFDAGGAAIFLCDPTNLKTTKIAKGPCEKAGGNWRCKFSIKVENMGKDPYKGRIDVVDTLSLNPVQVKHSDPTWSRNLSQGLRKITYTYPQSKLPGPNNTLPVGQSVGFDVTVDIPDGKYCALTNTAEMTFPVLERHNQDKTDDLATATVKVPRPECDKPQQCKPGKNEIRTRSGACACAKNFTRGKDGSCVRDVPEEPKSAELKLEKTCSQVGTSREVRCRITLRNTGEGVQRGPISLSDETTADGTGITIASASPDVAADWRCGPTPANPLGCSIDGAFVEPGASRHVFVTFAVPNGRTSYRNCVEGTTSGSGDVHVFANVCAEGRISTDECRNGMELNNKGLCVCPDGTEWNGRTCYSSDTMIPVVPQEPETRTCPDGTVVGINDACPEIGCPPGMSEVSRREARRLERRGANVIRLKNGQRCAGEVAPPALTKCPDGSTVPAGKACPEVCPQGMSETSRLKGRRLERRGAKLIRLNDGRYCVGEVPGRQCRQIWKDVCTTTQERECRKVTDNVCRMVPTPVCKDVVKQVCTTKPQRNCRKVTNNVCRMVPSQVCNNVTTQTCTTIKQMECKGTGEFRECKPVNKRICKPTNKRVCTTKMQQICTPQTKTECTTTNQQVCRPEKQRICSKKLQRVCEPKTKTECTTVPKKTCTRKSETVCK